MSNTENVVARFYSYYCPSSDPRRELVRQLHIVFQRLEAGLPVSRAQVDEIIRLLRLVAV